MRFFRQLSIFTLALTAAVAAGAPAAFAGRSVWAKGGEPTCTVTITSPTSSSTTCTGTLNGLGGMALLANVDVRGLASYQCQDATGATVPGQNQVRTEGGSTTTFTATKKNSTFTTAPAVLAAPSASASQAGCADGSTAVDPSLTTTSVEMWIATQGDAPLIFNCTVSDPDGLNGTVAFAC